MRPRTAARAALAVAVALPAAYGPTARHSPPTPRTPPLRALAATPAAAQPSEASTPPTAPPATVAPTPASAPGIERSTPRRTAAPPRARAGAGATHSPRGTPAGFLACVRRRESRGDYTAVNPRSGAGGAYQYLRSTWRRLGYAAKYGVPGAELASPTQQDEAARDTYARYGAAPWAGHCP